MSERTDNAASSRGPVHELDAGLYRAVIRDGVPVIERETTAGAVRQILVPCSPEIVAELSADWSEPVRWRIEDGEFVFRTVPDPEDLAALGALVADAQEGRTMKDTQEDVAFLAAMLSLAPNGHATASEYERLERLAEPYLATRFSNGSSDVDLPDDDSGHLESA